MRDKNNLRILTGNEGLTLIEVMIAIVILAVGFLAAARMQVGSIDHNALSSEMTVALNLAEEKMDELIELEYDPSDGVPADLQDTTGANNLINNIGNYRNNQLDSLVNFDNEELNLDSAGVIGGGAPGPSYRRIWNIVFSPAGFNNKRVICVVVTWNNDDQRVRLTGVRSM